MSVTVIFILTYK